MCQHLNKHFDRSFFVWKKNANVVNNIGTINCQEKPNDVVFPGFVISVAIQFTEKYYDVIKNHVKPIFFVHYKHKTKIEYKKAT